MNRIGERIVSLRKEKGIRQAELSRMLGMPQATLSGYENGHREVSAEWLPKMAEFFDVSADYLLGLTEFRKSSRFFDGIFLENGDSGHIKNREFFDRLERLSPEGKSLINILVEMLTK